MKVSPHNLTSLDRFFKKIEEGKTAQDLGFSESVSRGNIIIFANRYRVAKSFRGILLDEYTERTANGYSALFKLFLAWSTFEQLLKLLGIRYKNERIKELCDKYEMLALCERIKHFDNKKTFYEFLQNNVDEKHKIQIQKFFDDEKELNISFLISSIRHVFAHGKLTPHSNKSEPTKTTKLCNELADFLLDLIDAEFTEIIH